MKSPVMQYAYAFRQYGDGCFRRLSYFIIFSDDSVREKEENT
jgi:hypothetical protein